jgi:hypothetical protein
MAADRFREIHKRICDPGHYMPRGDNYREDIPHWSARAVDEWVAENTASVDRLLVEAVKRRDEAAHIPQHLADDLLVHGMSTADLYQRYANAVTVITEILTDWSTDADEQPAD